MQKVIYDQKWQKFLKRTWIFRHLPFLDFVLAAGSMAIGNVNDDSDFDIIAGVRAGRIFTARFFAIMVLALFGWRRTKIDHRESARDKICLNHFITPASYRLSPPHNEYWQILYKNLVPVFGGTDDINTFWMANKDWMETIPNYRDDLRHQYRSSAVLTQIIEKILGGSMGDWLENLLKKTQIRRISSGLKQGIAGYQPRIIYNDNELEFHPDTKRIQDFLRDL